MYARERKAHKRCKFAPMLTSEKCQHIVYIEGGKMKKGIRATYIAARMINSRPDYESCEGFCKRVGLTQTHTVESMMNRKDIAVSVLYKICKALGYQIIIYNPKAPNGLNSMYVVGTGKSPISPKELKGRCRISRDAYTGEIYRVARNYKKKKKKSFVKVGSYGRQDRQDGQE